MAYHQRNKPGRNDPCPCGSGKKFKRCCIDKSRGSVGLEVHSAELVQQMLREARDNTGTGDMGSEIASLIGSFSVEEIAGEHEGVIAELKNLSWIETAATFAGLLTMPELQANCFRLEALVHLAVAFCDGDAAPTAVSIAQEFSNLGEASCGKMEDPAEDVFVRLVSTPHGNFRIFEGLLESAAFHLQRIVNIVESMPNHSPFDQIKTAVWAMLRLSDAVAERAGVQETRAGNGTPHAALPADVIAQLSHVLERVRFTETDLENLQIRSDLLSEFIFDTARRTELRGQRIWHNELERRPIVVQGGYLYILLPTAIAAAIIRLVLESLISFGLERRFEDALCREYAGLFRELPILGGHLPGSIPFQPIEAGYINSAMKEVDPGRFLHLFFFVDSISAFPETGLSGFNAQREDLSDHVRADVKRAHAAAVKQHGFRNGISLVVSCGFGRGFSMNFPDDIPPGWRVEVIGASDLITLSWVDGFDALSLWRILDAREALKECGVKLININGLLNLVAWSKRLGGHLVPHGELPDGFVQAGKESAVLVPQDAVRELRQTVAMEWNPRRVLDPGGAWVEVWKFDRGEFAEDNLAPLYASTQDVTQGKLRAVYVAPKRPWWITISAPPGSPPEGVYERWMMLCAWIRRAAPILDESYSDLAAAPISYNVSFDEIVGITHDPITPKNEEELKGLLEISTESGSTRIVIRVARGFDDGLAQPENTAERVLVAALVHGAAKVGGEDGDVDKQARLIERICPNAEARWAHRFQARSFRDFVRAQAPRHPVFIDSFDDAASRIGLGWRVRSRDANPQIVGVTECTAYLNDVVRTALDDLCGSLRTFNRRAFIEAALENHESTASDRDLWKQTARAILGMHDDKAAALRTIIDHNVRLNASFAASRILLEAAVCECPLDGGNIPGRLDLSRAMSRAVFAHHVGGWSDAIHWGAMEPRVRVTPLGDVYVNHQFMDQIYEPFGRAAAETHINDAVESYVELYEPLSELSPKAGSPENEFLKAWEAEFEAPLDRFARFVDELEALGQDSLKAVLSLSRSRLIELLASAVQLPRDRAAEVLDLFTLKPRAKWRAVPPEYADKDWFPWRYGRRLSVLRRPLLQIEEGSDPTVFFAPALVRDALYLTASSFYRGEIPPPQAKSAEMRGWIGHANNVHRTKFNSAAALRMRELGWHSEAEVKLTKLLGRTLSRNYGDIDVLAWRPESGRVLAIECKDLQYQKTLGHVAEQLTDFRGEVRADGKPDHLRRHLDRLDLLKSHEGEVAKALKLSGSIHVEGHLVFKNLVPMKFGWDRMATKIKLSLFSELDRL